MRASEVLGLPVRTADGRDVGIVVDLRCVQDGPIRGAMAAPRVHALVVSGRHTGSLLGYDRTAQQGPWLVRRVVQALHRNVRIVDWAEVAHWDSSGFDLL